MALLEPFSGRNVVTPDVAYVGPVDRYLALLAATAGEHEQARRVVRVGPRAGRRAWARGRPARGSRSTRPRRCASATRPVGRPGRRGGRGGGRPGARAAGRAARVLAGGRRRSPPPAARPTRAAAGCVRGARVGGHGRRRAVPPRRTPRACTTWRACSPHPGSEFHALELVGGGAAPAAAARDPELTVRRGGEGDAGPLLDAQAKAEYRERLAELQAEIDEAESFHDPERARRAREELDFLSRELSAAVGLGGRDRPTGAAAERARVNVTRALRTVIERIAEHDAGLGHHLRTCVRTGTFCAYEPGPGAAAWKIDSGRPDRRRAARRRSHRRRRPRAPSP